MELYVAISIIPHDSCQSRQCPVFGRASNAERRPGREAVSGAMSLRAGAPAGGELGALSPAAVVRVLLLYACIWFVHGLLYHGRRHLRRVLARRTRARPITARQCQA
ncbi:uncharacterized protein [Choristoneura fumiferana]|uniref:uncharacterized protein n=1 Tax=Choristoneura fumiferana TaxID=7141 RepID=UPI003D15C874